MNPTHFLFKGIALFCALILAVLPLAAYSVEENLIDAERLEDSSDGQVLDDLVIERERELSDVRFEADDTLSVLSSNQFTTYKAINSGPGAAVNFDLFFAPRSAVMNANGYAKLEQMAKALSYMDNDTLLELQVHIGSDTPQALAKRRTTEVLARLRTTYGIDLSMDVRYLRQENRYKSLSKKFKDSELLALTLVNLGTKAYVK